MQIFNANHDSHMILTLLNMSIKPTCCLRHDIQAHLDYIVSQHTPNFTLRTIANCDEIVKFLQCGDGWQTVEMATGRFAWAVSLPLVFRDPHRIITGKCVMGVGVGMRMSLWHHPWARNLGLQGLSRV